MAQDQVLDQRAQARRKVRQAAKLVTHHPDSNLDMADQLTFVRIGETTFVVELVNLADIVEYGAGEQQVQVNAWIVRSGKFGQCAKAQHVFDQSTQKSVVDLLRRRRAPVPAGSLRIVEKRFQQCLKVRVGDARNNAAKLAPHLFGIAL